VQPDKNNINNVINIGFFIGSFYLT
jgi:hypothetical protein